MYITLETSYINFYSMISTRYCSYVGYICYVEECKFSTSTHENLRFDRGASQLSVAIFMASRARLVAQKCLCSKNTRKNMISMTTSMQLRFCAINCVN